MFLSFVALLSFIAVGTYAFCPIAIEAGSFHVCVLTTSELFCHGLGEYGELGQGNTDNIGDEPGEMGMNISAIDLGTNRTAVSVSGGMIHTCALLNNNGVKCWGFNGYGGLGYGHETNIGDNPGEMGDDLPLVDLGTNVTVIALSSGYFHSCALLADHSMKCWGSGGWGQLGKENTNDIGDEPGEMGDNLTTINLGSGRTVLAISAGGYHTCALLDNNALKCFGDNSKGQLGKGNTINLGDNPGEMGDSLTAIDFGTGRTVKAVSAGASHNCVILDNDSLKCWGNGNSGALGQGNSLNYGDAPMQMGNALPPINLGYGRRALEIFTGDALTCAILDDHTLKCWGRGEEGQTGRENNQNVADLPGEMGDSLPPINLGSDRTVLSVATGAYYTCALLDDHTLKCFGRGDVGTLGQGNTTWIGVEPNSMGDYLPTVDYGRPLTCPTPSTANGHIFVSHFVWILLLGLYAWA